MQPGNRQAHRADRFDLRFAPGDDGSGQMGFRPREPIPPRLRRFDPRIVELVRLLGRETAREVIEQSLKEAGTHDSSESGKD